MLEVPGLLVISVVDIPDSSWQLPFHREADMPSVSTSGRTIRILADGSLRSCSNQHGAEYAASRRAHHLLI